MFMNIFSDARTQLRLLPRRLSALDEPGAIVKHVDELHAVFFISVVVVRR